MCKWGELGVQILPFSVVKATLQLPKGHFQKGNMHMQSILTDRSILTNWSVLTYWSILTANIQYISYGELSVGGWWVVYLDYSVSSGPFLRFTMSFEFLSEMFDHSVSESRDPSLTILLFSNLCICQQNQTKSWHVVDTGQHSHGLTAGGTRWS